MVKHSSEILACKEKSHHHHHNVRKNRNVNLLSAHKTSLPSYYSCSPCACKMGIPVLVFS